MKALLQKVSSASVAVDGKIISNIKNGLLIFLGIAKDDSEVELKKLAQKCCQLRIFEDENLKLNRSVLDVEGEVLIVSQFTLLADTTRGLRPGFEEAAAPEKAENYYLKFINEVKLILDPLKVKTGIFRAMMKVELINEGPVTIILETNKSNS
ncbi:MAG: D-aminoacyl-tRNA deacylase [Bacteroidetes bacterium]|nr:D-aminoacyl-tRNA deacylase [Bacteroidota bacterium]